MSGSEVATLEATSLRSGGPRGGPAGLWLLLVLLVTVGPMLVSLGSRDTKHTMENVALVVSQETWLRWHAGEERAWLVTTNDSLPRVEKPPMLTWLNLLAWAGLDPATAAPSELVYRARLVSVGLGALMLVAIFWLGCTVGDLRLAIFAALIAGTTVFLQRQARTASYDIHFVAWATLAVASAVWAMKPRCAAPHCARAILGWLVAGLAMAASVLSKNPLPLVIVVLYVGTVIALQTGRRRASLRGLLWAVVLALLIVTPWYAYVLIEYEDAVRTLWNEFRQPRAEKDAPQFYYYLCTFGLVLPWTFWLISGLAHPFMPAFRGARRRLLLPVIWFALILLFFSIPEAKQQRYILPIIPAAALLAGRVWRDHEELAEDGRRDASAGVLIWAHWIMLLLISVFVGPFLAAQDTIIARFAEWQRDMHAQLLEQGSTDGVLWNWVSGDDLPTEAIVGSMPWIWAIACGLILVVLAVWGLRTHRAWRPMRAGFISALWSAVFLGVFWYAYGNAPSAGHPMRGTAEAFRDRIGDAPVLSLRVTDHDRAKYKINEEFRFYFGRLITRITPETIGDRLKAGDGPLYVLARDTPPYAEVLNAVGLEDEGLVQVDKNESLRLWARTP